MCANTFVAYNIHLYKKLLKETSIYKTFEVPLFFLVALRYVMVALGNGGFCQDRMKIRVFVNEVIEVSVYM